MKPLIRSEDFDYRNIQVSTKHPLYGNPHRVGWDNAPWCPDGSIYFGEWVQVDLGKSQYKHAYSPYVLYMFLM